MSDTVLQCVAPSADAAGVTRWEAIDLGGDAAAVARVASLTGDAAITTGVLSLTQAGTSARRGARLARGGGGGSSCTGGAATSTSATPLASAAT